jgi:hypothetical protein
VGVVAVVKWEVVKIIWDREGGNRSGIPVRVSGPYISPEAERFAKTAAKGMARNSGEYYARPIVELPILPPEPPPIDDRTWELGT